MEAVLQTLLGGLLAIAGAIAGPHLQRRHDRWTARREDEQLIRNKAQELFEELDRLSHESAKASVRAMEKLKDDSLDSIPVPQLGQARAIAALYFPSSLKLIEDFEEKHGALAKKVFEEADKAIKAGDQGVDVLKALPIIMITQFQSLANDFVFEMRAHIIDQLPKMLSDSLKTDAGRFGLG